MKRHRVEAMVLRHMYNFRHNMDRVFDSFYWPAMDILLWGLTSAYLIDQGNAISNIVLILLSGLVYWQVVWRSQYEITVNLLEEMWSNNLVNVFSTPLTLVEWVMAVVSLGVIKMLLTVSFAIGLVWLLYGVNILSIGMLTVPFLLILLASGWWIGFLVAGVIVRYGTRIQTLAWAGVYLLAPFSAIFYPVATLPEWAQRIAYFVPMSQVFEGMRQVIETGQFEASLLIRGGVLTVIYMVLAIAIFGVMFGISKKHGLSSLD